MDKNKVVFTSKTIRITEEKTSNTRKSNGNPIYVTKMKIVNVDKTTILYWSINKTFTFWTLKSLHLEFLNTFPNCAGRVEFFELRSKNIFNFVKEFKNIGILLLYWNKKKFKI